MFPHWVRIAAAGLIVLVIVGVAMHYLFVLGGAPPGIRWGFVNIFVSTAASLILTFLAGVLLFDYQRRVTAAEGARLLGSLLVSELSETIATLDHSNSVEIRLADDPTAVKLVIVHLRTSVIEEAARSGHFDRELSERLLRLARRMVEYNTKISALLSLLSEGSATESSIKHVMLHTVESIEALREAIVEECDFFIRQSESREHLAELAGDK